MEDVYHIRKVVQEDPKITDEAKKEYSGYCEEMNFW